MYTFTREIRNFKTEGFWILEKTNKNPPNCKKHVRNWARISKIWCSGKNLLQWIITILGQKSMVFHTLKGQNLNLFEPSILFPKKMIGRCLGKDWGKGTEQVYMKCSLILPGFQTEHKKQTKNTTNQPTTEKKHTKKPTNKFPQVSYPIMADYKVIPASLNRFRNRVSSIPSPSSTFTGKDLSVAVKIHSHQVFCKNSLLCYQRALYRVSYYSKFQMNNLKFQLEANKMIAKLQSREGGFGKIHLTASSSSPSAYHRLLRGK